MSRKPTLLAVCHFLLCIKMMHRLLILPSTGPKLSDKVLYKVSLWRETDTRLLTIGKSLPLFYNACSKLNRVMYVLHA